MKDPVCLEARQVQLTMALAPSWTRIPTIPIPMILMMNDAHRSPRRAHPLRRPTLCVQLTRSATGLAQERAGAHAPTQSVSAHQTVPHKTHPP